MNCYECATQDRVAPGVAICVSCGVSLCLGHAQIGGRTLDEPANLGTNPELHARMVACPSCVNALALQDSSLR